MFPENINESGYPKANTLNHSNTILTAYGGTRIKQRGICTIQCKHQEKKAKATFFVTKATSPPIIGLSNSLNLNLFTLNCSLKTGKAPQISD